MVAVGTSVLSPRDLKCLALIVHRQGTSALIERSGCISSSTVVFMWNSIIW